MYNPKQQFQIFGSQIQQQQQYKKTDYYQIQDSKISQFSVQLFQKLSNSDNLVFSPCSIYLALSMAALGAEGQTLEQFKQLLQFNNPQQLVQSSAQLQQSLSKNGDGITMTIANKIYCGLPQINQEYIQILSQHFGLAIEQVDFYNNHEQIRTFINQWVTKATNEKICDLLTPKSLDENTKMVLVNAIYFKGEWQAKFNAKNTIKCIFNLEYENKGKYVQVDTMIREGKYNYYKGQDYQYVSIPYKGGEYAMEIILPTQTLQQFEKNFTLLKFSEARKNQIYTNINLLLPKFKIQPSQSTPLKDILSELGIPQAFSDDSNFKFMDLLNNIKISDVYHKAMIEVNEDGAVAAASTAVSMTLSSSFPPQMSCTKPFIYSITHIPTKTITFLGKVTNPSIN